MNFILLSIPFLILLTIYVLKLKIKKNPDFKSRLVKTLGKFSVFLFIPSWLNFTFCILLFIILNIIVDANNNYILDVKRNELIESSKVQSFDQARDIIPGTWISKELLSEDLGYQNNVLIFQNNGMLKFAQGGSDIDEAIKLANNGSIGNWKIIDKPEYLQSLINENRFLIEFELSGYGSEILRVEVQPGKTPIMGRIGNSELLNHSNSLGLFDFEGKVFHKQ